MADYNIEQLESLTGFSRRTIRYYIQQGLVEAPFGARKTPSYTEHHVEQLLKIKQFKDSGLNLRRIAELLQTGSEKIAEVTKNEIQPSANQISLQRIAVCSGVNLDIETQQYALNEAEIEGLRNVINNYLKGIEGANNE